MCSGWWLRLGLGLYQLEPQSCVGRRLAQTSAGSCAMLLPGPCGVESLGLGFDVSCFVPTAQGELDSSAYREGAAQHTLCAASPERGPAEVAAAYTGQPAQQVLPASQGHPEPVLLKVWWHASCDTMVRSLTAYPDFVAFCTRPSPFRTQMRSCFTGATV